MHINVSNVAIIGKDADSEEISSDFSNAVSGGPIRAIPYTDAVIRLTPIDVHLSTARQRRQHPPIHCQRMSVRD